MLCMILAGATHDVSSAVSSYACCCAIESGVTVAIGVAVWDVINFRFLFQRHMVNDVSLPEQVMMVNA